MGILGHYHGCMWSIQHPHSAPAIYLTLFTGRRHHDQRFRLHARNLPTHPASEEDQPTP